MTVTIGYVSDSLGGWRDHPKYRVMARRVSKIRRLIRTIRKRWLDSSGYTGSR